MTIGAVAEICASALSCLCLCRTRQDSGLELLWALGVTRGYRRCAADTRGPGEEHAPAPFYSTEQVDLNMQSAACLGRDTVSGPRNSDPWFAYAIVALALDTSEANMS